MEEQHNLTDKIQPFIDIPIVKVSKNVEQNCIITTEDKVHIIFDEYNNVKKSSSDALNWLGIFIALLVADFTCTFRPVWVFDASTIRAMFYIATLFFLFRVIKSGIIYLRNKEKLSFEFFLNKIKGEKDNPNEILSRSD